jgi:predicted nicotinamide N-methyase
MENQELDQLLVQIRRKYPVDIMPLKLGNRVLKLLQITDFEDYLGELIEVKAAGLADLPYWAKVWEASMVLAYFLGKQPVVLGQKILEIGAGLGVVGIYAALLGHQVTISDINEDALQFARANAALNNVRNLEVRKIDWNDFTFTETYDVIVGSEIVYDRKSYPALVQFLLRTLQPGGMIFLAKNAELHAPAFFVELTQFFEFKQTTQTIHSDGESQQIVLYAIRPKAFRFS